MSGPDWIIVFGFPAQPDGRMTPTLSRRIAAAVLAARRYPKARLIVSGGPCRGSPAEAAVMARALRRRGIAGDRLLEDRAARDTMDTVRFALRAIPRGSRVLAVTSRYHLPRCLLLLRLGGLAASGLGAGVSAREAWSARLFWPAREFLALPWDAALAVLARLRRAVAT